MSVESVTQSVSNLALRFSEDDEEDEDGMVGWADGVGAVSEELCYHLPNLLLPEPPVWSCPTPGRGG